MVDVRVRCWVIRQNRRRRLRLRYRLLRPTHIRPLPSRRGRPRNGDVRVPGPDKPLVGELARNTGRIGAVHDDLIIGGESIVRFLNGVVMQGAWDVSGSEAPLVHRHDQLEVVLAIKLGLEFVALDRLDVVVRGETLPRAGYVMDDEPPMEDDRFGLPDIRGGIRRTVGRLPARSFEPVARTKAVDQGSRTVGDLMSSSCWLRNRRSVSVFARPKARSKATMESSFRPSRRSIVARVACIR